MPVLMGISRTVLMVIIELAITHSISITSNSTPVIIIVPCPCCSYSFHKRVFIYKRNCSPAVTLLCLILWLVPMIPHTGNDVVIS